MNLNLINEILKVVFVSGINQIVFSVKDDNKILVSGIDKDGTVVLFHMFDNNGSLSKSLGIHRLSVFMDRLRLFNLAKVTVEKTDKNYFTKSIMLKEGNKKISYMFSEPTMINAPKEIIPDDIETTITLSQSDLDSMFNAAQTIDSKDFYIVCENNNDILFRVVDDSSGDVYEEVIGNSENNFSHKWSIDKFFKLLKQNFKTTNTTKFQIGKHGYLSLNISGIDFLLLPLFVE